MVFETKVYKSGKQWLAEIPELDAMTQGRTRKEAIRMAVDWIQSAINQPSFKIEVSIHKGGAIYLITEINSTIIGLYLQRQRLKSGLTTREVAEKLGYSSHNSYAQYEQGRREASISELEKFMRVLNPKKKLELKFG